jgi:hypothetical protein
LITPYEVLILDGEHLPPLNPLIFHDSLVQIHVEALAQPFPWFHGDFYLPVVMVKIIGKTKLMMVKWLNG